MHHQFDAVFDKPAAAALIGRLSVAAVGMAVTLDFCRTRHFEGAAFAALATFLASHPGIAVTFNGLGHSHRRVLQYLGVRARPSDEASI